MSPVRSGRDTPQRRAAPAALGYAALVIGLACIAWSASADLLERRAAVAAAADILARLESRRPPAELEGADLMTGSPFLEGATVTVAGAGLMQRISAAVGRMDGRITSSQVELQGSQFGAGFAGVTANLEIAQPELQALLYDLEAGMPFLFVDQLVAQAPTVSEAGDGRMRVLMTVYGQWQGAQ